MTAEEYKMVEHKFSLSLPYQAIIIQRNTTRVINNDSVRVK
jgi:hypothetical protein